MAGLYFFPFLTCRMGPKPSALETGSDPEVMLFKRLDSMQPREHVQLRPGRILVAVYGDNWSPSPAPVCTASTENPAIPHAYCTSILARGMAFSNTDMIKAFYWFYSLQSFFLGC